MRQFTKEDLQLASCIHGEELISILSGMLRTENQLSMEVMFKPMLKKCLEDAAAQIDAIEVDAA